MSFIIEISDKILHLQLILAPIPTACTHLIVEFVIQQTKFAYIMQISYHLAIFYLWCNVHEPKEDENVTKKLKNLSLNMSHKLSLIRKVFVP